MFLYNKTNISLNKLTNNVLNISVQIRTMALQTKDLSKGTAIQVLNEISIEYDFSESSYIVKSLGKHQELPPFQATCEVFKNKITFSCIGEPAPHKKSAKQNAEIEMLEMLSKQYTFSEKFPVFLNGKYKNIFNQQ